MRLLIYIRLFCVVQIFASCGSAVGGKKEKSEDGSFEAKIIISAGDDYYEIVGQDTFSFTPYPYNYGVIKNDGEQKLSCLVLSNRLSKNSRINILPIGLLNYIEFNEDKKLIIAIPREQDERVIAARDLLDLVSKYPAIKSMIQDWTLGKCGIGCAKLVSWEDASAAGLWIERNAS